MSNIDIVRAWKDAEYRQSLSAEELARLPEHPSGAIELADEEVERVGGGRGVDTVLCLTITICPDTYTTITE